MISCATLTAIFRASVNAKTGKTYAPYRTSLLFCSLLSSTSYKPTNNSCAISFCGTLIGQRSEAITINNKNLLANWYWTILVIVLFLLIWFLSWELESDVYRVKFSITHEKLNIFKKTFEPWRKWSSKKNCMKAFILSHQVWSLSLGNQSYQKKAFALLTFFLSFSRLSTQVFFARLEQVFFHIWVSDFALFGFLNRSLIVFSSSSPVPFVILRRDINLN